ncbi:unnamed protein product [Blepharisma stoltei]|uniref:Uncharacterized protein n=1 Tax=Blepharisma stoltei TaxID=1481888 RepID=A0AAU9J2Z4_9CILI|nr:unnamed protein product [Blepharisma stoltei]
MSEESISKFTERITEGINTLKTEMRELRKSIQGFDYELNVISSKDIDIAFLPNIPNQMAKEIETDFSYQNQRQEGVFEFLKKQIKTMTLENSELEQKCASMNSQLDILKEKIGKKRLNSFAS